LLRLAELIAFNPNGVMSEKGHYRWSFLMRRRRGNIIAASEVPLGSKQRVKVLQTFSYCEQSLCIQR
jgi:hypothetical protein